MPDTTLVDALRHCLVEAMVAGAPMLVAAFAVGIVSGLLQAATGIHEDTFAGVAARSCAPASTGLHAPIPSSARTSMWSKF